MKITKSQLKQIIKEEIEAVKETLKAGSIEEDDSRDGPFLKSASQQGPGIPSEPTNPRELTAREQLVLLKRQLQTARSGNLILPPGIEKLIAKLEAELAAAEPEAQE
jgi:hypothetical protein